MKPILTRLLVIPFGAILSSVTAAALETSPLPVATRTASHGGLAGDIHSQVNAYRRNLGKPDLQRHAGLDRLARQHAEFMRRNRGKFGKGSAGNLTHHGFEERTLAAQRAYGMSDVAENVGTCRGAGNASGTLVGAWKRSRGHDMNLKGKWTRTGIGVVVDSDGTVFATQLFGTVSRSHPGITERMRRF